MALTDKQRQFVDAKARGASNKEAAEATGCKAATASAAGSRWANDPKIAAAILARKAELSVNPERRKPARKQDADPAAEPDDAGGEFLSCIPITEDPLEWLLALMNEPRAKVFDRRNAAQTAVPYLHSKKGELGKKDQKKEAAEKVGASGRFGLREPKLTAVK